MNCDPGELIEASKCFSCIPKGQSGSVAIYLLCQWANVPVGPTELDWQPADQQATWIDSGGPHVGDLATFNATADYPTVVTFSMGATTITSITGLQLLTGLQILQLNATNLFTIDIHGMTSLLAVDASTTAVLNTFNVSGCTGLTSLACTNSALTTLTLTGLTSLQTLTVNNSPITDLTGINTCSALVTVDCNTCDIIGTLNVSGLANLISLFCYVNANMTGVNITGCTSLISFDANSTSITTITGLGTCIVINDINCSSSNITGTLDCTDLASLLVLSCYVNNNLTGLTLTGCVSVDSLNCYQTGLITLDVSPCPIITFLDSSLCPSMVSVNIGASTGYSGVYLQGNSLPANPNGVDGVLSDLAANCLGNAGICDLNTLATNAAPTGGLGNVDYIALTGAGWTVTIN